MILENKELLLKDIYSRLSYGVKVNVNSEYLSEKLINAGYDKPLVVYGVTADGSISFTLDKFLMEYSMPILSIKPYLFPMSSMTEEQKVIYGDLCYAVIHSLAWDMQAALNELIDWLNKNHFDYRGLIPMGLAIDCTNLNIY